MSRRAPEDLRRLALCWCYEHLDEGLAAHRLAALWLEHRVAAGAARGDVPDALLTHLDEPEAQRALEELKRDGLLYARRLDGFQLTQEGLVLGRAMVQATAAARAAAPPAPPPIQELELSEQDRAFLAERERQLAEHGRVVEASVKVPAALLEGYTPAQLQAILEENLYRELAARQLRGEPAPAPIGFRNPPRSTT